MKQQQEKHQLFSRHETTIKFLNIQTPEKFAVITHKFEQSGSTIG